jgi:hypothetical protein
MTWGKAVVLKEKRGRISVPGNFSGSMMKSILFLFVVAALFLATAWSPVSAHSAEEMGIEADQYDHGIPVYWPFHAALMSAGLVCLLSGSIIQHFSSKPERFKIHRRLQVIGAGSVIVGLGVAVFMVSLSAAPHFSYLHDQLGAGIIILVVTTLVIGYYLVRHTVKPQTRQSHRIFGWLSVVLMAVNIILGITMMTMVAAQ